MAEELKNERESLDSIKKNVQVALINSRKLTSLNDTNYCGINKTTKTLNDLEKKLENITSKDIIQRGIYLVDGLSIHNFLPQKDSLYYKILSNG